MDNEETRVRQLFTYVNSQLVGQVNPKNANLGSVSPWREVSSGRRLSLSCNLFTHFLISDMGVVLEDRLMNYEAIRDKIM